MTNADSNSSSVGVTCVFGNDPRLSMECLSKYFYERINGKSMSNLLEHQIWIMEKLNDTNILVKRKKLGVRCSLSTDLLNRFLNRLLGAPLRIQKYVLESLNECMKALIDEKKQNGTYKVGICGKML